jgi:hypothetical protein
VRGRQVCGRCVADAWQVRGRCMASAWQARGRCVADAWQLCARRVTGACKVHSKWDIVFKRVADNKHPTTITHMRPNRIVHQSEHQTCANRQIETEKNMCIARKSIVLDEPLP